VFSFLDQIDAGIFQQIPIECGGSLFVSPMPFGPYDTLNRVMRCYRRRHVQRVIVLVTEDEIRRKCKRNLMAAYRKAGIQVAHNPVVDLTAPKVEQLEEIIDAAVDWLHSERIAVHCNAGVGRTGVVVGCLAARMLHLRGEQALDFVHQHMHVNLTSEQKRFINDWADKRFHG
jgi:protein-tyrosine phosphatase